MNHMSVKEGFMTLIQHDTSLLVLLAVILIFFWLRVHLLQYGTYEYSYKTAGKRVGWSIFTMIVLSYLYNIDGPTISEDSKRFLQGLAVAAYAYSALIQSVDKDNPGLNTLYSLAKFVMIYLFSVSDNLGKFVVSILFAVVSKVILRKHIIKDYDDKVKVTEILITSASNILLTILLCVWRRLDSLLTPVMLIVFEETVMFVINLAGMELCKEYIDDE